tara:strand:+ start:519 stop:785 length:267 start_codon:yes stop_codon:yes gene_type:complete
MEALYFLVVSFVLQNPTDIDRPLFVYYKPNFTTYNECHVFANKNNQVLYGKAAHHYDNALVPEAIYCLTGEQVKEIHNTRWEEEKLPL